jgi:peptide/nickel transport system ATP-binding protein
LANTSEMSSNSADSHSPLLEVENLKTYFYTPEGILPAVNGIDFSISAGEAFGLVGESGCGKSVTALSLLRLVPQPPGKIVAGRVRFQGREILGLEAEAMRRIRGKEMAMIFQEPMTSLNPVLPVGEQIAEALRIHFSDRLSEAEVRERSVDLMRQVQIAAPEQRVHDYPHQLSGGLRQRVMMAMALACRPLLLIADEPTTALDVTIQAQILELIKELQTLYGLSLLLITHNLGLVGELCRRAAVMYAGKIVELSGREDLFHHAAHPYTRGLLASIPRPGISAKARLPIIPGRVPELTRLPKGCSFQERCPWVFGRCRQEEPELTIIDPGHQVRCWKYLTKNM